MQLPFPPNEVRWPRDQGGHYESYWLRANALDRRFGLWLKYNLLAAKGTDAPPMGECWAVLMDGDRGHHVVAKQLVASHEVDLAPPGAIVKMGASALAEDRASGEIPPSGSLPGAAWSLQLEGDEPPIVDYPEAWLYTGAFPKKKIVLSRPFVRFTGTLRVGDDTQEVDGWTGIQGHNWGREHAFDLAYANANRFDQRDDARFEGGSARLRLGPFTTPRLTIAVLRLGTSDYAFNAKRHWLGGSTYGFPRWSFLLEGKQGYRLSGSIEAPRDHFVGLCYADPTGALADCLNTKFGHGELLLERKTVGRWEPIQQLTGDAFELEFLLRDVDHGISVVGGDPFQE